MRGAVSSGAVGSGAARRGRARGAALLAVLSLIACLAIIAALYALHAQYAARASANNQGLLDAELLALSACEEVAANVTIGSQPPLSAVRSVTNRAGRHVGTYAVAVQPPARTGAPAGYVAAWFRDRAGRWRRPVPACATPDGITRSVQRVLRHAQQKQVQAMAARLADAFDPDDELSVYKGAAGCEALAPGLLQPSRVMCAVPFARYDSAAWVHAGRLGRGWGERYTAPMHLTVRRRLSEVTSRRASLVFALNNLDAAARRHADVLMALHVPGVHALGAAHQWRGTWIKAVGRDTDSCLGGALTNLMWLRVVDNVIDGEDMRFECEPALEATFHDQFISNALGGSITYGLAGWHTHGDPLVQRVPAPLTTPELAGLLAPSRCAAELAEAQPQVYIGDAALVRALDPAQRYTVVLHAPGGMQPHGLEVWHNDAFTPVRWEGTRAVLFEGVPQQPVAAAGGEGVLLVVFRVPARAALALQGLTGIELAAAPPHTEWQVTTRDALDLRLWDVVWLAASGRTQVLQRVPLQCHGSVPLVPPGARVRLSPGAARIFHNPEYISVPVIPIGDGPCARIVDVAPAGSDPLTGLWRYHVSVAEPLRVKGIASNWWLRVWPATVPPDQHERASTTNLPFALQALPRGAQQLELHVPPGEHALQHALVRGAWLEHISDWLAWGGALAVRTPRGEHAARVIADELPPVPSGTALVTPSWLQRWRAAEHVAGSTDGAYSFGVTRNIPAATWAEFAEAMPPAVRASPALAAACVDTLTLLNVPAEISNTACLAACYPLDGMVALSNLTLYYSWPPLAHNILRGYFADLRMHGAHYRGLIVSNDHTRIIIDMPGRAPRTVDSVSCRITTPYGEPLWYLAGGVPAQLSVPAPWPETQRAQLALSFLQPAAADIMITLSHHPGGVATQLLARSRATWLAPPLNCRRCDAPLQLVLHAGLPRRRGVLFARPAWLPCAAPNRPPFNILAPADTARVLPLPAGIRRALLAARPLASMSACAARVPVAARHIWRIADAISFPTHTMSVNVHATAAGFDLRQTATFDVIPREGQTTATVLYRVHNVSHAALPTNAAVQAF